jgi:hypothetical protein
VIRVMVVEELEKSQRAPAPGAGVVSIKVGARYRRLFRSSDARVVYLALTREFPVYYFRVIVRYSATRTSRIIMIIASPRRPERTRYPR